ncbi:glycosyltransferase [Actinoplanes sp. LDG1-06]|uniref:Glycosyltransferase n=1 Tax=Paractinoplanes ovalisporus TaxID=2810368 RepID=A0ABS2ASK8_9ACTN|nr:glycosyltransferase [Actinoplanes ovalisporus]MBM2622811.1 glycosyltransferase [Actinoplanes ovalisporus]
MMPRNPFRDRGMPVVGDNFVGRSALTRKVTEVWQGTGRPGNLSVIGYRRAGKTSLIRHGLSLMDRSDLAVVQVSVIGYASVFEVFHAVASQLAEQLTDVPDLVPLVERVGAAREWYDLENAVSSLFKEVGRHGRFALLVFEEFDRAPLVLVRLAAFQLLRSLASEPDYPVGLITVSRRPVIDIETDAAGGSRLDGVLGEKCYVGTFTPDEARRLIARSLPVVDLSAVSDEIIRLTGRQPYLLHTLCSRIVDDYLETGVVDVVASYDAETLSFHEYFERLLDDIEAESPDRGRAALLDVVQQVADSPHRLEIRKLSNLGVVEPADGGFHLFSDGFAAFLTDSPALPPDLALEATPDEPRVALVVATEWKSRHGGLSTLNRHLCLGLAAQQVEVYCMVLAATDDEVSEAKKAGVHLLRRPAVEGAPELNSLLRRPELPEGVTPSLVIGHGRVTGSAALVQAEDHFPGSRRLHFVHMAPDEIEFHKLDRTDDVAETAEARTRIELKLGRSAERVVAVGPRLHGRYQNYLSDHDDHEPIRFDPGFDLTDPRVRRPPAGTPMTVLTTGRMEDSSLKGLDIAAGACGLVAGWRHERGLREIELVVRGVPVGAADKTLAMLKDWAANLRLSVVPRNYTPDSELLAEDLQRSSLFIMPSRAEGFGLVGLEAIVAGTPVLISEKSGLGELLKALLGGERAAHWVVPMFGEPVKDTETWARSIEHVLADQQSAFTRAEELRRELADNLSWAKASVALLTEVGF